MFFIRRVKDAEQPSLTPAPDMRNVSSSCKKISQEADVNGNQKGDGAASYGAVTVVTPHNKMHGKFTIEKTDFYPVDLMGDIFQQEPRWKPS